MTLEISIPHSETTAVKVNGIETVYDTFGEPSSPPLLLINGLGGQMITWDEEFCAQLAMRGFWVIRFDNRDVGLATKFDEAGVPPLLSMIRANLQGKPMPDTPYTLRDMAADAIGLLDALKIKSAHVLGISMGGMIAQTMAIYYPERIRTLISVSSIDEAKLPPVGSKAFNVLIKAAPKDREGYIKHSLQFYRFLNGPHFSWDKKLARVWIEQLYDRCNYPEGTARQLAAIAASGSRKEMLKSVRVPTLVLHGDADPLVPLAGGVNTANSIPGAKLKIFKGMGHTPPPQLWTEIISAIAEHAT
jgi:pimeloyl-ACP methyl ester carboxylesterase